MNKITVRIVNTDIMSPHTRWDFKNRCVIHSSLEGDVFLCCDATIGVIIEEVFILSDALRWLVGDSE